MLMLGQMFLSTWSSEEERIIVPLPQREFRNDLEFLLKIWVALLTKLPSKLTSRITQV